MGERLFDAFEVVREGDVKKILKRLVAAGFIVGLVLALAGFVLYRGFGVRIAMDGSGRPGFVMRAPDYEALEADRARQRAALPPEPVPAPAPARVDPPSPAEPLAPARPAVSPSPTNPLEPASPPSPPSPTRPPSSGEVWSDFRGSGRDGRYTRQPIRTEWPSDGLRRLWRQPVGPGYASFVAAEGRIFTIEQRRTQEVVAAYDLETGRELWTNAWDGAFTEALGGEGPRATPTYHRGRLFALGALGELRCLNARSGAVIWRRNILSDAGVENLIWGMSAAPLIVDDTVVVLPGGPAGKSVAAYSQQSGEIVWTSLDDPASYTSPMLVELAGVRQLLIVTATRVVGLPPGGGQVLWEQPWETYNGINVAQPLLLGNDRFLMSAGYSHGAMVLEVKRDGDGLKAETVWQNNRMKNKFTSSVLHDGFIYGLDEAILACVDAATGEVKWKGGRYGYGQVLLAGDRLIVLTEDGDVVQVKATPSAHQEVARFEAIDGKTWNHPIIVDGRLVVRNIKEMAAFDIRAQ